MSSSPCAIFRKCSSARIKQSCYSMRKADMSDKGIMPRKAKMADGHPQHVLMRASQHQAVKGNREL